MEGKFQEHDATKNISHRKHRVHEKNSWKMPKNSGECQFEGAERLRNLSNRVIWISPRFTHRNDKFRENGLAHRGF
jgi:hypothetical protein